MISETTLDPENWDDVSDVFHQAIDHCIGMMKNVRERPIWRQVPSESTLRQHGNIPTEEHSLNDLFTYFQDSMLPYSNGNTHPRFFGWVHGSGNIAGVMGEMLAAFMNSNVGGRDHAAVYIERQVLDWCKQIFSFPEDSSGVVTTGTSMGTMIALTVARNTHAGGDVQKLGLQGLPARLVGYTSSEAHCSVAKTFDLLGLGQDALRRFPVDEHYRMDIEALKRSIAADRAGGLRPIAVVASAGTVNTGAIDDLCSIADICRDQNIWMHVDGAFGGLAVLAPEYKESLAAIARADSIAFDFHKWMHVPYDAGCVLIKNEAAHRKAFSSRVDYLTSLNDGLAGGEPWFCEYGPELSRGFRALKVWFTIQAYGIQRFADLISQNCRQASYLGELVKCSSNLQLLAEVTMNIVCFRYFIPGVPEDELNELNKTIVTELQTQGIAAPSTTTLAGRTAIRVAITNHRTVTADLDLLVDEVCRLGRTRGCK